MEIQLWRELLHPYEMAVEEIVSKFNALREEYKKNSLYSPIERVTGRVKSVSSILEKMQRKNVSFENLEQEIEDIAGVRVICQFVEDIEKVASLIVMRQDMKVIERKDYLANQKKSGYRSLHLIVEYMVETIHGPRRVLAEIQIRTMAMNFWATTEHSLQYKYKGEIPPHVSLQLSKAADAIFVLDNEMSQVRSEIIDAQIDSQIQTRLVKDILTAIENLYHVASTREVRKIQDEFYRIYSLHDLEELKRFQKQLDIFAEGYRAQSVDSAPL
ncbi:MAG: GTP pyrophosphokinase family protein [Lachnospiraceae bacterium]|nr:GTP pyrophosphokinase family protein [Lachnospiraceae bacterium]